MGVYRDYYPYPRDKRLFELAKQEIVEKVPIPIYIMDHVDKSVNLYSERKMCCPLHHEETPSFIYYDDQQKWTCFGSCSTSGKVIDLHQKLHGIKNYYSALMHLKEMYGKLYNLTFKNFFIYDGNKDMTVEEVLNMTSVDEEKSMNSFAEMVSASSTTNSPHLLIQNIEATLGLLKQYDLDVYIKQCIKYDALFSYQRSDPQSLADYYKNLKEVLSSCKTY